MAEHKYILALDQGTTSSRAIIFDETGSVRANAQAEFSQVYPQDGWVEHDPNEIYSSLSELITAAVAQCGITRGDLCGIGITNQRETTVVWEKSTGKPIYNAIVWQCRRTSPRCDELMAKGYDKVIYRKTGLPVDAYFSATKLEWILDNVDGARERAENGELLFGTIDTYLMWKFSGGEIFATDYTNASRTMLFNIHELDWDDELLELFNIPRGMLPRVLPSGSLFGNTDVAEFGASVPIAGVAGDQQAALFGHRCTTPGSCKNTFGTGCFMLMNTGSSAVKSKRGLITTVAASTGDVQYALEGSVFIGGAIVQWLRDGMRMIETAQETEKYANAVDDTLGVYVVPAFVGLGAPYWDAYARGTVTGITRGTTKEHMIRAALESISYQVFDVLHAMERDCGTTVKHLAVDGGAAANNFLMQFTADICGCDVVRPTVVEITALGVYYLAGITLGVLDEKALPSAGDDRVFSPNMPEQKRTDLLAGWAQAVQRARRK